MRISNEKNIVLIVSIFSYVACLKNMEVSSNPKMSRKELINYVRKELENHYKNYTIVSYSVGIDPSECKHGPLDHTNNCTYLVI